LLCWPPLTPWNPHLHPTLCWACSLLPQKTWPLCTASSKPSSRETLQSGLELQC
jgi:hypothetical protein